MKKVILKFASFVFLIGLIGSINFSTAHAQSDPLKLCPDGNKDCARSKDGKKVWHKGNSDPVIADVQ